MLTSNFLFQYVYHGVQHGLNEQLEHHAERHLHLSQPEHQHSALRVRAAHPRHHQLPRHVQGQHVSVQGQHECVQGQHEQCVQGLDGLHLPRHELLHSLAAAQGQAAPGCGVWLVLSPPGRAPTQPPVLMSVHGAAARQHSGAASHLEIEDRGCC